MEKNLHLHIYKKLYFQVENDFISAAFDVLLESFHGNQNKSQSHCWSSREEIYYAANVQLIIRANGDYDVDLLWKRVKVKWKKLKVELIKFALYDIAESLHFYS